MAGHLIKSQKVELVVGFLAFILGSYLIYDAIDKRGKKLAWPLGAILPW